MQIGKHVQASSGTKFWTGTNPKRARNTQVSAEYDAHRTLTDIHTICQCIHLQKYTCCHRRRLVYEGMKRKWSPSWKVGVEFKASGCRGSKPSDTEQYCSLLDTPAVTKDDEKPGLAGPGAKP